MRNIIRRAAIATAAGAVLVGMSMPAGATPGGGTTTLARVNQAGGVTFTYTGAVQKVTYLPDPSLVEVSGSCSVSSVGSLDNTYAFCQLRSRDGGGTVTFGYVTEGTQSVAALINNHQGWDFCVQGFAGPVAGRVQCTPLA